MSLDVGFCRTVRERCTFECLARRMLTRGNMHQICFQVFGFLLGIDLQGMSGGPGGAGEDGEDQMRGVPTPPPATQAQSEAQPAEEEEEEEVRYRLPGT